MQSKNPNKGNWKSKFVAMASSIWAWCKAKIPIKGIESIKASTHQTLTPWWCKAKIPIKGIESILSDILCWHSHLMQSKNPNKGNWKFCFSMLLRWGRWRMQSKNPNKGNWKLAYQQRRIRALLLMQSKNPNKGNWKWTLCRRLCRLGQADAKQKSQ